MARREDIDTGIWNDPDFLALSPEAKLVYLHSFTNSRCGMAGLYMVISNAIQMETGLTAKRLDAALTELREARFVHYDGRWMWVRTRIKHLRSTGINIAKSIRSDVERAGTHEYAARLVHTYGDIDWMKGLLDPFKKALPNPLDPLDPLEGSQGRAGLLRSPNPAKTTAAPPVKFEDKIVPQPTLLIAEMLLADFNRAASTQYKPLNAKGQPTDALKRILGALTDDDRINGEVGRRMISAAFRSPWWQGQATTGVVFGPRTRERYLAEAMATNGPSLADDDEAYNAAASAFAGTTNGAPNGAHHHDPETTA